MSSDAARAARQDPTVPVVGADLLSVDDLTKIIGAHREKWVQPTWPPTAQCACGDWTFAGLRPAREQAHAEHVALMIAYAAARRASDAIAARLNAALSAQRRRAAKEAIL